MAIDWAIVSPLVVGLITGAAGYLTVHVQHKGKPENALIDQLQEQINSDRLANKETADVLKADIKELKDEQRKAKRREQVRDNYIIKLREHINLGNPPPPPEWPEGLYD